ncbi:tRNA epoxyqueuosine(34) reductase QueG [Sphingomonas sp. TREG-RG-20F-R18-01]|uniref:tRNA epoxyqueuosine(34) reductase QueG n=1 Tax=Sphingomonas sp. TREG-RG-20F-R18-01 TaxID=2914982 RepID=UPI001F566EF5|nr:tRNA epoxyqueuosine(34) reductase QueG [Sphingomonas sp. TREG-RG-20F-R18-01]
MQEDKTLLHRLRAKAAELGFVACGVARADAAPRTAARLREWLDAGMHGGMIWMEERAHQRQTPSALWPEVRSVIALGMSYAPATDPLALAGESGVGRISVYAQGGDYHDVVKRALKALARWLVAEVPGTDLKVFVDTAPVMEKPLSAAAGLGWQGKHTNLVSREHGSWLFLGAIYTTLEAGVFEDVAADGSASDPSSSNFSPFKSSPAKAGAQSRAADGKAQRPISTDGATGPRPSPGKQERGEDQQETRKEARVVDRCGSCDACQRACPTDAFPSPYRLDARRCISYLTIEHAGPIPHEFRARIGNRIYGCDDCLAVCPWNKFAESAAANRAFLPRAEMVAPRLADLLALDDASFRQVFAGSPIKRIGRNKMMRNCLIAAGNSGDAGLIDRVQALREDPDPVVAEAADWALTRLT